MPDLITDTYLTIVNPSTGLYKDRGSKFISFAFPVETEQEAKTHLEQLRKEYFDARHHCFAYRLGAEKKNFRAFDDGEPSNSAGKPILGQITAHDLTNILVVVVRYFGGTLLGVGGLVQAYKNASADALAKATIIEKEVLDSVKLTFDYQMQNAVNRILKEFNVKATKSEFDYNCRIEVQSRKNLTPALLQKLTELQFITIITNELPNQNI